MMSKLDTKDKKILYELDKNSRSPNSEIAKKVGLSKQAVGSRINGLIEDNVISSFFTIIDISKLGLTIHKNFLRLQNLDKEKEIELINFLTNNPNVVWVCSCDGTFDIAFGTWAKDMEFLDRTITELNNRFGEFISERQIATIIKGEFFTKDYLAEKKTENPSSFFGSVPSPVNIDLQDWQILLELGKNSRSTAVSIGHKIGISADTVAQRIKKLEKSGIIKGYNIVPNESKYPYLHYKVLISFRNISAKRIETLMEYCRVNQNIVYIVKALGPWEFEMDLEVEDVSKFRETMMKIKTEFKDIIKDYSVLNIYQVHKYNFCPSIQL